MVSLKKEHALLHAESVSAGILAFIAFLWALPTAWGEDKGGVAVFSALEVKARQRHELTFVMPPPPAGRDVVLTFQARLAFDRPAGYAPSMRAIVNGQALNAAHLFNKKATEERVDGRTQNLAAHDHFTVGYAPDFDSPDKHPNYAFKHAKVCAFELRVTGLVKEGKNTLVVENAVPPSLHNTLVLAAGRIEFRSPLEAARKKGPPSGPLPVFVPAASSRIDYALAPGENGELVIKTTEEFRIQSEFSTPEPRWQKGSNRYFTWQRQIERLPEAILVRDTFSNLTDENLPLMQQHRVTRPFAQVWLSGLAPSSQIGTTASPANPTAFGATAAGGIGLLPLDDVFLVHVKTFSDGKSLVLADHHLVLPPRAKHTAEWAIVLTSRPDYYAFVNAVRRLRQVNFPIAGAFAFLRADPRLTGKWTDQQLTQFARFKNARFLCSGIEYPTYQGHYSHGTAFGTLDHSARKAHIARLRKLVPEAKQLVYYHCFIDVHEEAAAKYADARLLKSDGQPAVYGEPHDRIFFPTAKNSFGRDIGRNVDLILGDIGADGVYWDEMEYSAFPYHYGQPWDGVSADIDAQTMKISRLKSSVTLLSQPWRLALAKRILARAPLIANGAPHTRTMAQLHFPRFVETGSISNCLEAQLFTPIALGDHLTEANEKDAYQVMLRALNFGCVYYWYDDVHVGIPTHAHLTQYMFPITPVELHRGFIIGQERILTNRSGRFGWGDDSQHEVHVFNDDGREVPLAEQERYVRRVKREGQSFTELRIGEGWSAAILRR